MIANIDQAMEIVKLRDLGYDHEIEAYIKSNGITHVIGYHVTPAFNLAGIRQTGLRASSCYNRTESVYMFLDAEDAARNVFILLEEDYVILKIKIPITYANLLYDGLYNGTFDCSYSAVRLEQSIPPAWIKLYKRGKFS
jgi:hypothetical protein